MWSFIIYVISVLALMYIVYEVDDFEKRFEGGNKFTKSLMTMLLLLLILFVPTMTGVVVLLGLEEAFGIPRGLSMFLGVVTMIAIILWVINKIK